MTLPDGVEPFRPALGLAGPHRQTLAPLLWPAGPGPAGEPRTVHVAPEAAVRVVVVEAGPTARGTLLLVHGIGGSAESGYMRRTAARAATAGWTTVRMNCRNAGGTEHLSRTLFNATQSDDVGQVLAALSRWGLPRPHAAVGFSLGASLVLRYVGTAGAACLADAVAGINPPVDLGACADALERPGNRRYGAYFTWGLCRLLRRIRRLRPVSGPRPDWWRIRTVRRFDHTYIAPDAGFASADAYYAAASAGPRLAGVRVPALILSAADDPFVPVTMFPPFRREAAETVRFVHPRRGGHLGYWQRGRPRFWAAEAVLGFLGAPPGGRAGARVRNRRPCGAS